MKAKQLHILLIALLVLGLAGFGAVGYGANKLLSSQAAKLSTLRADSSAADSLQTSLAKNKQDITKYSDLDTIAETVVPQDKDQAEAIREIVNLAGESGIDKLSSVTFPTSELGATGAGAKSNPNLTQLTPVKGISGVYELQITVTQTSADEVSYSAFTNFLSKLEQNRRTAQVSSITVQPDAAKPGLVSFNLVINEFIKP
ncbi:MAG TPA: hypothetical protein VLE99_03705 [Candidatus Saccharimonadales bacterium]|nr:hypothetical protein [Candidatus Saccharimonadales bacterium]